MATNIKIWFTRFRGIKAKGEFMVMPRAAKPRKLLRIFDHFAHPSGKLSHISRQIQDPQCSMAGFRASTLLVRAAFPHRVHWQSQARQAIKAQGRSARLYAGALAPVTKTGLSETKMLIPQNPGSRQAIPARFASSSAFSKSALMPPCSTSNQAIIAIMAMESQSSISQKGPYPDSHPYPFDKLFECFGFNKFGASHYSASSLILSRQYLIFFFPCWSVFRLWNINYRFDCHEFSECQRHEAQGKGPPHNRKSNMVAFLVLPFRQKGRKLLPEWKPKKDCRIWKRIQLGVFQAAKPALAISPDYLPVLPGAT